MQQKGTKAMSSDLERLRQIAEAGKRQDQKEEDALAGASQQAASVSSQQPLSVVFVHEKDTANITEDLMTHCGVLRRKGVISIASYQLKDNPIPRIMQIAKVSKLIVCAVLSPHFLAHEGSDSLFEQVNPHRRNGTLRLVIIRAKACDYRESPYGKLLYIPHDKPIDQWSNRDDGCYATITGLKRVIEELRS